MLNFTRIWRGLLLVAFVSVALPVKAEQEPRSVAEIIEEQRAVREDILKQEDGWDAIAETKRTAVIERQDSVLKRLSAIETLDQLDPTELTTLSNDLEWIRSVALDAEGERIVCTRERKTGSNRVERVCRTAAQIARDRREASEGWQRVQSHNPAPPGESGSLGL